MEVKGIISKDGEIKSDLDFLTKEYYQNNIKGKYYAKIEDKYWVIKSGDKYIIDDFDGVEKLKKELEQDVIFDPLTGCYNKKESKFLTEKFLKNYLRYNTPLSALMIDIDFFKKVNDTYGHLAGDFILKEVAKTIKNEIRESDICGRFGGEEFIVLLPNTKLSGALKLANRIRSSIENKDFIFEDINIPIRISTGLTNASKSDSIFSLIDRADTALYDAKHNGRNRTEYR